MIKIGEQLCGPKHYFRRRASMKHQKHFAKSNEGGIVFSSLVGNSITGTTTEKTCPYTALPLTSHKGTICRRAPRRTSRTGWNGRE